MKKNIKMFIFSITFQLFIIQNTKCMDRGLQAQLDRQDFFIGYLNWRIGNTEKDTQIKIKQANEENQKNNQELAEPIKELILLTQVMTNKFKAASDTIMAAFENIQAKTALLENKTERLKVQSQEALQTTQNLIAYKESQIKNLEKQIATIKDQLAFQATFTPNNTKASWADRS